MFQMHLRSGFFLFLVCSSYYIVHLSSVTVGVLPILVKCKILSLSNVEHPPQTRECLEHSLVFSAQFQTGRSVLLFRLQVSWPLCPALQPTHWTSHFLLPVFSSEDVWFLSLYLPFENLSTQWWFGFDHKHGLPKEKESVWLLCMFSFFHFFSLPNVPACICGHFCCFENFL